MSKNHQVFVVDDDRGFRQSMEMLLASVNIPSSSFEDGNDFLSRYEGEFGVVLLDVRMPGLSGLDVQRELNERPDTPPIIFITGHGDIPMAVQAMRSGAVDFLTKPFRDQELLDSIAKAVDIGQSQIEQARLSQELRERFETLTPRELEVFERVAAGQANKVIAIELGISQRTVEIHRANVMQKMQARSLADLVRAWQALES